MTIGSSAQNSEAIHSTRPVDGSNIATASSGNSGRLSYSATGVAPFVGNNRYTMPAAD
ncbi:MAG: hypothetical protein NTW75_05410 [Planctomycetales bacterium]|nr:hypothetical protein [Planctomycetales bacterium]